MATYIRFKKGKVKKTKEIVKNTFLADYDEKGNLLGVEILVPFLIESGVEPPAAVKKCPECGRKTKKLRSITYCESCRWNDSEEI